MSKPILLIVGARNNSLGESIFVRANAWDYGDVFTAGIRGEHYKLDVTNNAQIKEVLDGVQPDFVVCTVGVNVPFGINEPFFDSKMTDAFRTNVIGPMDVLRHFLTVSPRQHDPEKIHTKKFVAISSNSAHIPRTRSIGYCASKAALSMAIRTAARELAGAALVWGYEPGLIHTALTYEVALELPHGPLHRMRGVEERTGLSKEALADRILWDLSQSSMGINGTMIPFDAGEL